MCAHLCESVFVYTTFVYVKERGKDANKCVFVLIHAFSVFLHTNKTKATESILVKVENTCCLSLSLGRGLAKMWPAGHYTF